MQMPRKCVQNTRTTVWQANVTPLDFNSPYAEPTALYHKCYSFAPPPPPLQRVAIAEWTTHAGNELNGIQCSIEAIIYVLLMADAFDVRSNCFRDSKFKPCSRTRTRERVCCPSLNHSLINDPESTPIRLNPSIDGNR